MQIERFNNDYEAVLLKIFPPKNLLEQAANTEVMTNNE